MSATATLITRNAADRTPTAIKTAGGLAFYAFIGSWVYAPFSKDFDDVLVDFPEALSAMLGGGLVGAPGGYITSVMLNLMGPLVFLGLAIAWGSAAIAGEETSHTARLLLVQPINRRQLLATRATVLAGELFLAVGVFVAALGAANSLFDDTGPSVADLAATGLHLALFAIAIGAIAFAVSAATGTRGSGIAVAVGVGAASYLIDSFAPLTAAEGVEHWTPWYLYSGHAPISNGIDVASAMALVGIAAAGVVVALVMVDRRDLEPAAGTPLLQRIPAVDRAARPRLTNVFARTLSGRLPAAVAVGGMLALLGIGMALLFDSVQASMADITDSLPTAIHSLLGGAGLDTPVGWMNAEMVTILAPAGVLAVALSAGAEAVAGERDRHSLALALSTPLSRDRFLADKLASLVVLVVVTTALAGAGLALGSVLGGLDLTMSGLVGVILHLTGLGLFFGLLTAALGTRLAARSAMIAAAALAGAAFLAQAVLTSVESLHDFALLSPWQYFAGGAPLANGPSAGYLAVLVGLSGATATIVFVAFRRSDAI